jgi:hypothetical protein
MQIEFSATLFALVRSIVFRAIANKVNLEVEGFLKKRKINSRLEDSIAQVIEQLLPFFENERISETKRNLLTEICRIELDEILKTPQELFASSMDGQKVFDRRYASGTLPQAIREESLEDLYALIFPQIANLICVYPPAVEQWKIEGYRENFRRLDDIANTLGNVAIKLDSLASKDANAADILLKRVRQSLIQRVEFQLDLTGLRGDRPDAVPLEKCFIVPELQREIENRHQKAKQEIKLRTEQDISQEFSKTCARILIIGPPGSGKSTWSQWFQKQQLSSSDQPKLAVLARLRDLTKRTELPSHQEIVRDAAGTHLREDVDSTTVREWCQSGTITFILDGFDEVPPNQRDAVLSWIKELANAIDKASLILTSRPLTTHHLENLSKQWVRWELLSFDEQRVVDYIARWYAHAPILAGKTQDIDATELANRWLGDSVLKPLAGIPLMLATLLMVHHMDGELPRGRSRLYERYIDGMLGLWDSRWGIPTPVELSLELKKRILTRLALKLHLAETEQLGDDEIESFLFSILQDLGCTYPVSIILDHLRERSGLLIGPGTWNFVHKSIGEFLVAAAICDGDQTDDTGEKLDRLRLLRERHNDRWNTVLFFWAGLTSPGDLQTFIEQVTEGLESDDFILAVSLIYDQLQPHRLTEQWRNNQILKLLNKGHSPFIDHADVPERTAFGSFYPAEMKGGRLFVPLTPLRTLGGFLELGFAIREFLKVCNLDLEAVFRCHESLFFYVWVYSTIEPRTISDFQLSLSNKNWKKNLGDEAILLPLTHGICNSSERSDELSLQHYVDTICNIIPEISEYIILFIFGSFSLTEHLRNRYSQTSKNTALLNLLQCARHLKSRTIDLKWLQSTKNFASPYFFNGQEDTFDLLKKFLETLDKTSLACEDALINEIRTHAIELINKRDSNYKDILPSHSKNDHCQDRASS